jgi:hypothetical protein
MKQRYSLVMGRPAEEVLLTAEQRDSRLQTCSALPHLCRLQQPIKPLEPILLSRDIREFEVVGLVNLEPNWPLLF